MGERKNKYVEDERRQRLGLKSVVGRVGLFRNEFRAFNFVKHQTGKAFTCSNKKHKFGQIVKTVWWGWVGGINIYYLSL